MAEFLEMNSHMKSWLNSLILNYSWFSFKFLSVKENVLLIQSNHHPSFAVSSLQALRLLHGCCSVATRRRCCDCKTSPALSTQMVPEKVHTVPFTWKFWYSPCLNRSLFGFPVYVSWQSNHDKYHLLYRIPPYSFAHSNSAAYIHFLHCCLLVEFACT